ncbi:MAG TPA: T9SS type A sorting domain-containing protein, partial [Chitinophagales bacterium]|nr:T9SS type A sorting domain-containing protein [Chitinophagales bacterium]
TANWDEIKTSLICTARKDAFTTNTANNEYGHGKVNAYAAVTQTNCITFGAVDTFCINYNPQANVDSGTCIARVYGCTDSTADNYNPLANVSDGSCTYTGISNVFGNSVMVKVVPNPFSTQATFKVEGLNFETGEIRILNQMGALVDVLPLITGRTEYVYHSDKLAKGIYYYLLNADGKNVKAGKLIAK